MLSILSAAVVAVQPLPVDFDLADAAPVYEVSEDYYSTDPDFRPEDHGIITGRQDDGIEQRRVIFHVLNAADLATTVYCLEVANNCREANPLFGQNTELVIVGKLASAALYELALDRLRDRGDIQAVRVMQYGSIVILGGVVAWNIRVLM